MEQNHYFDAGHPLRPYTHSLDATPGTVPPVNALRGKKPTAKVGYHPGEENGKWISLEDHRGEKGYLDGQPHTISDFGPLPDGWSTTPLPPTQEEHTAQRRAEIMSRLTSIDAESVRPLRAIASGENTEADHNKLAVLDKEAEALRDELATLAAPEQHDA